ncbi:1-phosphofructokinase family hexose kinase [Hymenobacter sp. BT523]|uniref:1-phosphofructokinase family hexose kinase n=1 Tax=Hymenobacter sp. BT523 TaxID=2795725 RepID=UPI0018EDD21A|nr:1-phosphofructokinase family hexose kinase [Hymenobacter sp. BT523]MBJ6111620.1 1-phosphofructokinase family hexose kinase [Hymenobacter sp. BT523]
MPVVVTLTLSPALDKSTSVPTLVPDQKLHCAAPTVAAGGGGINVARGLRRLGTLATAVFPAGGPTGACLQELLTAEGIAQCVVPTQAPTRENLEIEETSTGRQYRFGMPAAALSAAEQQRLLDALADFVRPPQLLVVSGSLPPGVAPGFLGQVVRQAHAAGTRVVADTSGPALCEAVAAGAFLIKPNREELGQLAGTGPLADDAALLAAARPLVGPGGCGAVLVSLGAQGACLVAPGLEEFIAAPAAKRRSTVGAGDSLVAGLVHALAHGHSLREAARLGVACGTAATLNPGTELFHRADAEALYRELLRTMPAEFALA